MNKQTLKNTGLLFVGLLAGVFLVTSFDSNLIAEIFASGKAKIGAEKPPVVMNQQMKIINDSFVNASEAVVQSVVSINVEAEVKGMQGGGNSQELDEFFKFFGPNFGGRVPKKEKDDDEESDRPRTMGAGSGVIISSDGYIVTNNHVVENAFDDGIKVILSDKKEYKAKLIGTDPATDLAVIKIEADGLKPAHFADINSVRVGEFTIAVGNPLGLNSTVTSGIVSAIGRGRLGMGASRRGQFSVEYFIQTDAAINPGNSGGGLFDLNGSLIGINTAIATETGTFMGYGFAIPVDLVKSVVADLIDKGKINRGFIGVEITSIRDIIEAKGFGLNDVAGVIIQKVRPESAGKDAGLENGDVILELDGKPVKTSEELQSRIAMYRAGDKVNLTIWRDGKKINKSVTLKSDKSDDVADSKGKGITGSEEDLKDEPMKFEDLGFSVKPLDKRTKNDYEVSNGLYISDVKRYGPVAQRGLSAGGVILKADRKEVRTTGDLKDIINSKNVGDAVLLQVKYKEVTRMIAIEITKKNG